MPKWSPRRSVALQRGLQAEESRILRYQCYDFGPQDGPAGTPPRLSWEYSYQHLPLVHRRIVQAGVRLAGVLNKIYQPPAGHQLLP